MLAPHKAKSRKFKLPWVGPYLILERISEVNYKIVLKARPNGRWQIVHYNRLKLYSVERMEERIRRPMTRARALVDDSSSESEDDMASETVRIEPNPQERAPRVVDGDVTERHATEGDDVVVQGENSDNDSVPDLVEIIDREEEAFFR